MSTQKTTPTADDPVAEAPATYVAADLIGSGQEGGIGDQVRAPSSSPSATSRTS